MSSHLKAELAATCSTLGRLHKGEYLIEPECIESVKDLIRYLKRDGETHEIRRYLGESKVLQNDLIHIIKSCPEDNTDLFDVTLRLLINLTTPTMLFYGEDVPAEKTSRNIYLALIGYSQDYKIAFCDVEFWNKICGKLTNLFETDWTERSADDGIQIERILMLLRNVVQVPADEETEKRPENDITVHDKVLWALRRSQILELLLFISSNKDEEQYYLNLLEIFSLILREQNPKLLARCDVQRSAAEKTKDTEDLIRVRESEKKNRNKYLNMRNFNATFLMKGVKSLSNMDVVCHKSLDKVSSWDVSNKKQARARRNRIPVESERIERRSSFSVRLFLKEFCLEFLNSSFNHLMSVVKSKLDSGKSLANDQTYYFWALKFFLDFATTSDSDVELIRGFLSSESFHFVQTSMDNAFEHLMAEKKKTADWVKRIHLILKAYHSLLETLLWMDCSKNPLTRSVSREIKSQIFYVVEYREMTLHILLRYDPTKFSISYLRDLIETTHLFIKLLEEYSKQVKLVVQKVMRKRSTGKRKKKKEPERTETPEEKWEKIKDDVYDILCSGGTFPEIPPFDAALDIPIDEQKGRAMKKIQKLLLDEKIREAIGFLRSARQVWPENDHFGGEGMSVEDETMALQEICLADLGEVEGDVDNETAEPENEDEEEQREEDDPEDEDRTRVVEQDFDIMDYKKRLVNKKVVEGCGILLSNYKKNSDHTNHCVVKLLHRIGWECCMPAMLFQASIFWTLLKIMRDNSRNYSEINTFAVNLLRKFRKHASQNPVVFLDLLFWKEHNVALEIQHGYQPYETKTKPRKKEGSAKEKGRRKKNSKEDDLGGETDDENQVKGRRRKGGKRRRNQQTEETVEHSDESDKEVEEESGSPKTTTNASRILFDNTESDEERTSPGKEHSHEENANGEPKNPTDSSDKESSKNNEQVKETPSSETPTNRRKPRRAVLYSSDEENTPEEKETEEEQKSQETADDSIPGKDTDESQKSNESSKKRGRKERKKGGGGGGELTSDDSDNGSSKSKRIRYVGSDSDAGNLESDEEEQITANRKKGKRKLAVIDSDSDVGNSSEEK